MGKGVHQHQHVKGGEARRCVHLVDHSKLRANVPVKTVAEAIANRLGVQMPLHRAADEWLGV